MDGVIIVDGTNVVHRAFAAAQQKREPYHGDGVLAATVVLGSLLVSRLTHAAPHWDRLSVVVAFDGAGDSGRKALYPPYKQRRPPRDSIIIEATQALAGAFDKLGLSVIGDDAHEADDWIATVHERASSACEIAIVSGDGDLHQLLDARTTQRIPLARSRDGEDGRGYREYTEATFRDDYQFAPRALPDYKALAGDHSDDIPGVRGIGQVWARRLIARWGSLDALYANLASVTNPAIARALLSQRDEAYLFRRIATLRRDLPLPTTAAS